MTKSSEAFQKVIFLHTNFRAIGGIEKATINLARGLQPFLPEILLISRDSEESTMKVINHGNLPHKNLLNKSTASWSKTRKLKFSSQIFCIPITLLIKLTDSIVAAKALRKEYKTKSNTLVVLEHQSVFPILFLAAIPKANTFFVLHRNPEGYQYSKLTSYYIKFILNYVNLGIALTTTDANYWKRLGFNVMSIPNLVNKSNFQLHNREKNVLWIGRLAPIKKITDVLEAFRIGTRGHEDWKLIVIGDGEDLPKAQKYIVDHNLTNRVMLRGFQDPRIFLESASFLLLASESEGFGLVTYEAIQNGVIPIVLPFGKNTSELIATKCAVVCEQKTPQALAERLRYYIENPNQAELLRKNCMNFDGNVEFVINSWLKLINT